MPTDVGARRRLSAGVILGLMGAAVIAPSAPATAAAEECSALRVFDVSDKTPRCGVGWAFDEVLGQFLVDDRADVVATGSGVAAVVVAAGATARLTLEHATIEPAGSATGCPSPITIGPGAALALTVTETNTLVGSSGCPAIQVPAGASLAITGTGELVSAGGAGAAAIGTNPTACNGGIVVTGQHLRLSASGSAGGVDIGTAHPGPCDPVFVALPHGSLALAAQTANNVYVEAQPASGEAALHAALPAPFGTTVQLASGLAEGRFLTVLTTLAAPIGFTLSGHDAQAITLTGEQLMAPGALLAFVAPELLVGEVVEPQETADEPEVETDRTLPAGSYRDPAVVLEEDSATPDAVLAAADAALPDLAWAGGLGFREGSPDLPPTPAPPLVQSITETLTTIVKWTVGVSLGVIAVTLALGKLPIGERLGYIRKRRA